MENLPTVKWICPMCTYENWPKSIKCTICLALRDLPLIEDEMRLKMSSKQSVTSPLHGWDCPQCTFSNSSVTVKCSLCQFPKPASSVLPTEPHPASNTRGMHRCSMCTYENWFTTITCPMCQNTRQAQELEVEDETNPWLNACKALVTDEVSAVQDYLFSSSHDPGELVQRKLTIMDCHILDKWLCAKQDLLHKDGVKSPFQPGLSLIDVLARTSSRHRPDLANLFIALSLQPEAPTNPESLQRRQKKRSICQASPLTAQEVRRMLGQAVRQRKGDFPCYFLSGAFSTFALPSTVSIQQSTSASQQGRLFSELLDSEVQAELEGKSEAINWWVALDGSDGEMMSNSRLFALWNRTDGDCLLDSLFQASWGVFDKQRTLRQALSESLLACEKEFYRAWRDEETRQTDNQYYLDEIQVLRDWSSCLKAASHPRESLEQIHIFVLAHILHRPIVVYSVKYINNFRDEPIGISNFQGVYLPMLWETSFCSKNPLFVGYTRGHFSALVPMEMNEPFCLSDFSKSTTEITTPRVEELTISGAVTPTDQSTAYSIYLPLFDRQGIPLPVPFVSLPQTSESGVALASTADLLRDRLETVSSTTSNDLLLVRLRLPHPRHPLVQCLVLNWLSVYQSIATSSTSSLSDYNTEQEQPAS